MTESTPSGDATKRSDTVRWGLGALVLILTSGNLKQLTDYMPIALFLLKAEVGEPNSYNQEYTMIHQLHRPT